MGLKEYFRRERRHQPRHSIFTMVDFCAWDTSRKRPCSEKGSGCLTDISSKGACLETRSLQMRDYHLFLDDDPRGKIVLGLEIPSGEGEEHYWIQSRVVAYDKFPEKKDRPFHVRLQFVNSSPSDAKKIEELIRALEAGKK
ncbi:MAG TPA: hypothetical protein VLS90_08900 [Thermodesulfobacteriota bacterium]|nr:hypothetical protein [Thermodesulfobacteriota bacterium]